MHIYNLTLQRATAITHAIFGNFSAPKAQEIVVARGKVLELLRPNDFNGKVQTVLSVEVFGTIRSIVPFRLTGKLHLRLPPSISFSTSRLHLFFSSFTLGQAHLIDVAV
jgi:hypothetical protein